MNKRWFVIILTTLVLAFAGWVYYVTTLAKQSTPVERISVDWWGSGHADVNSISFTNWNDSDPQEVPVTCAKCHSGRSFIDYLGQDGSTPFSVDGPGPVESVVSCMVCHNEKADALELANFPSGAEVNMGSGNALCGSCHSGLSAGGRVDTVMGEFEDDEVVSETRLITPHYAFAAATWLGTEARGGYEYSGKAYVGRFEHAQGVETCTQCHDPHSLRIRKDYDKIDVNLCSACHSNVTGYSDYRDVFVDGVDYDGDGVVEGVYHEIEGMREILNQSIQRYAATQLGQPIGWADQFPYQFNDTNADGIISADEAAVPNAFTTFTPRLMRAAFNYQFSKKDPAGYVHNGKYMLQLLYDSIGDLATVIGAPDVTLVRP